MAMRLAAAGMGDIGRRAHRELLCDPCQRYGGAPADLRGDDHPVVTFHLQRAIERLQAEKAAVR